MHQPSQSEERARSESVSLTALRLALGPAIVALAAVGVPGRALAGVVISAALSDVLDGVILRRAGVDAPDLRRWDTIADTIFYLGAATAAYLRYPDVVWANALLIMIVMGTQIVGHILEVSRFGRAASYHAWSGRLWGWAITIAFLGLFGFESGAFLTVALICGLISQLDNMAITMILPELRSDVRSVVHALRFRRLAVLLLAVFATAARLPAQGWLNDDSVKAVLKDRVASKRVVGIVVATLEKGKRPKFYAAGVSGSSVPLDSNTVFEIGSVTKVFTTALLAEMVKRGEVRLDDPISKYLPATVRVPSRNGKQITLLDLATQTSGLPRLPANLNVTSMVNPYADYTVQQMYEFLSGYALQRDIGARFEYSNLGMGLLGHVLALRAGKSYEALVTERVLVPLGMRDTRITLTPSMRTRLALGHGDADTVVGNWDLPTLAGAGALRSTASDMAKFLAANLDSTLGPVARALAVAHVPLRDIEPPRTRIGLGWITLTPFDIPLTWHNGQTGGYHSFIGFDQSRGRGVLVLANSAKNIDDIGLHLLDPRLPLTAPPKARTEIQINPALLDAYVGVYELAPTFRLAVTREGNLLFGQATGQAKYQLFPETETDFFWKVVDAQVTFVKDPDGKVNQIILHQGGANIPGKRVQ